MISKMREKCKNKKGFTLVELIVVLVILAILIALLVPSLTGYIDKANEKKVLAEAKLALNAVQTEEGDAYSKTTEYAAEDATITKNTTNEKYKRILALAEVKDFDTFTYKTDANAKVEKLVFANKKYTATYKDGGWTTSTTKSSTTTPPAEGGGTEGGE